MPATYKQLVDAANAAVPKISGKEAIDLAAKDELPLDPSLRPARSGRTIRLRYSTGDGMMAPS